MSSITTADAGDLEARIARLITAYPDRLARIDGSDLLWQDGTRMPIGDLAAERPHEVMLATATIADMLRQPYAIGPVTGPPALNFDPGRARHAAFFDKMYGDCRRNEVQRALVDVVWLPRKWGKPVKFTGIGAAADKLRKVSADLDQLPARFDVFLYPPAGTYNCRPIAGTDRISAHGHGIAIDISTAHADYWRWAGAQAGGAIPYRNRIPPEIVAVFERHDFIWGGKWYHYDSMHFEYRPELLPARQ